MSMYERLEAGTPNSKANPLDPLRREGTLYDLY